MAALERSRAEDKERRRLAEIAKKRELTSFQMASSEDGMHVAAIRVQSRVRTFLAMRRYALQKQGDGGV